MQSGTRDAKVEKQGCKEMVLLVFTHSVSVFHGLTLSSISHSRNFVYLIFKILFIRVYMLCILMSPFQKKSMLSVENWRNVEKESAQPSPPSTFYF